MIERGQDDLICSSCGGGQPADAALLSERARRESAERERDEQRDLAIHYASVAAGAEKRAEAAEQRLLQAEEMLDAIKNAADLQTAQDMARTALEDRR